MELTTKRRRRAKGRWMKLQNRDLLNQYIDHRGIKQADLARSAEVSRQFISALCTGKKATCTPAVADAIEERLGLLKGTLFEAKKSPVERQPSTNTRPPRRAA